MIVDTFTFDPPLWLLVTEINVYDIGDGCYDLFDQNGQCWNEVIFTFKPTKAEVEEWINTGQIKGKLVTVASCNCLIMIDLKEYIKSATGSEPTDEECDEQVNAHHPQSKNCQ